MGVIGHWRRSALGAGGVALLLPLGLALGVALTTAFGGRDSLHALAQVFSGPSAPGQGPGSEQPGLEAARAFPSIPLPHRPHRIAATAPATEQRSASGGATTAPPATTPTHTTTPTGGGTTPTHRPPSGGGGGSQPPAPSPPPPSQPAPQHSAVHNAGQQAADQAKALPAPVGPAAGSAAQTVVDLIP